MPKLIIKFSLIFLLCFQSSNMNAQCCNYKLSMQDSYGDGWNGATLEVIVNNISVGIYSASNSGTMVTFSICGGIVWT